MSKWEMVKLGEVCDVRDGTHDSPKYIESGYPLITSKNVRNGIIDFDNVSYISEDDFNKINQRSFVDDGDILMPMIGTIGNPIIVNKTREFAIKNVALIKFNNNNVLNRYVNYCLKSQLFIKYVNKENRGGTQKFLSLNNIRKFCIPLPPLEIQEHITDTLEKTQEIIDDHKKQLEELDNLIKAIFYDMFGDPGLNNKGWEIDFLSNVAPIEQSKFNTKKLGEVWLLNLDAIKPNTGDIIEYTYVNPDGIGNSTIMFDETNVLYSKLRPYLNKVVNPTSKGVGTSELVPFKPDPNIINKIFLTVLLRSNSFLEYINIKVAGAKMPRAVMSDLKKYNIILPPIELQNKFAQIVSNIEEQKTIVKQSITESENLFNSLMNQYFN